jgi:hypothetical protein|tara:strand:+ start:37 stop:564 length:528 start_codon:yes stop_codon:yes gene_type:complete
MATIFDKIRQDVGDRELSLTWYKRKVSELASRISAGRLMREGKILKTPGFNQLNFFRYNPKTKAILPYYDTFPLVMPIDSAKGGFLGINFHYLPIPLRMRLLETLAKRNFDGDYSKLKNIRLIKPCVKHYLKSQFASGFYRLDELDYAPAIFMPVQSFKKAGMSAAHRDARKRAS